MRPVDLAIRLEWIAVAVVALVLYALAGVSWWLFALLILAPDLSMLGYLAGPCVGAITYNALHILIVPLLLALAGLAFANPMAIAIALTWVSTSPSTARWVTGSNCRAVFRTPISAASAARP